MLADRKLVSIFNPSQRFRSETALNISNRSNSVNNNSIYALCAHYVSRLMIPAASMFEKLSSQFHAEFACSIDLMAVCL